MLWKTAKERRSAAVRHWTSVSVPGRRATPYIPSGPVGYGLTSRAQTSHVPAAEKAIGQEKTSRAGRDGRCSKEGERRSAVRGQICPISEPTSLAIFLIGLRRLPTEQPVELGTVMTLLLISAQSTGKEHAYLGTRKAP